MPSESHSRSETASPAEAAAARPPFLVMIRGHKADQKTLHLYDGLAGNNALFDTCLLMDETNGALDVQGRSCVPFSRQGCARFGLHYQQANLFWLCGDLSAFFGRAAHPGYDAYLMVDYDVEFIAGGRDFLHAMFQALQAANADREVDLVGLQYGSADAAWAHRQNVLRWFPTAKYAYGPLVLFSARLLDALPEARRDEQRRLSAGLAPTIFEGFVPSFAFARGWRILDFNQLVPGCYQNETMGLQPVGGWPLSATKRVAPGVQMVHSVYTDAEHLQRALDRRRSVEALQQFVDALDGPMYERVDPAEIAATRARARAKQQQLAQQRDAAAARERELLALDPSQRAERLRALPALEGSGEAMLLALLAFIQGDAPPALTLAYAERIAAHFAERRAFDLVLQATTRGLAADGGHARLVRWHLQALTELARHGEAAQCIERLGGEAPHLVEHAAAAIRAVARRGEHRAALTLSEAMLRADPTSVAAAELTLDALRRLGERAAALETSRALAARFPREQRLAELRAEIVEQFDDAAASLQAWAETRDRFPVSTSATMRSLILRIRLEGFAACAAETAAVERALPQSARLQHDLARAAEAAGLWAEAEQHWRRHCVLQPGIWWSPVALAQVLRRQGRTEAAEQELAEAVARFPQEPGPRAELALWAEQRRDWEQARQCWAALRQTHEDHARAWIGEAIALRELGAMAEAKAQALLAGASARFAGQPAVLAELAREAERLARRSSAVAA